MFKSLRDIPHEFILTIGDEVLESDLQLFFSFNKAEWEKLDKAGLTLTHYRHFGNDTKWEHLATALDQMPSLSQARKNGWNGEIPEGYSEHKRKFHRFYILKLTKGGQYASVQEHQDHRGQGSESTNQDCGGTSLRGSNEDSGS